MLYAYLDYFKFNLTSGYMTCRYILTPDDDSDTTCQVTHKENILFYRNLISEFNPSLWNQRKKIHPQISTFLNFLASQQPAYKITQEGIYIPFERRQYPTPCILRALDFRPVPQKKEQSKIKNSKKKNRPSTAASHGAGVVDEDDTRAAHWIPSPSTHFLLQLDSLAIKKALCAGPLIKRLKVYVSSATLIVVPQELIQHWRDQIAWHTRSGALRVALHDSPGRWWS